MKDKELKNTLVIVKESTDHPFSVIEAAVKVHAAAGRLCYQKYTCEKCKQRLTMEEPNVLYKTGSCETCGHVTDIEKQGCNYLLEMHNMTLDQAMKAVQT